MSTVVIQSPMYPTLLLSPDGSRDRNGPVEPNVGVNVEVVDGQYGRAWRPTDVASGNVWVPNDDYISNQAGTVLIRFRWHEPSGLNSYIFSINTTSGIYMGRYSTNAEVAFFTTGGNIRAGTVPLNETSVMAVSYGADGVDGATLYLDSVPIGTVVDATPNLGNSSIETVRGVIDASVESVLIFPEALTDAEIQRISTMDEAWRWESVGRQILRPVEVAPHYPGRGSRVTHVETVVYETDRNNKARKPLSGVTSVQTDWDIDRAGSKARVDIATHKRVLKDGMWVAPYLRITPEVGEIVEQQLGHFRLVTPSTIVDGSVDEWGDEKVEQSATGGDIVDLLADASLPYTFYTPVGGNVMGDVAHLIKIATAGMIQQIPIENHSFEADPLWDGWSMSFSSGASGFFSTAPGSPVITVADGKRSLGMTFEAGSRPVNGYGYALQYVTIPAGATRLMLTGLHLPYNHAYRGSASLRFLDADDNMISSAGTGIDTAGHAPRWYRAMVVADVPENAVTVRVYVESRIVADDAPWARPMWDDIRLYSITGTPLPDGRINLPPSNAAATSRIQTTAGSSIGYEAINADRLSAIGHHAIYTDLTGRLTTSPSRDLGSATVSRTYREGDYRFVGAFEVQRSANNRYNTVTAVKESFEEGVPPLFTTVWNDDPDDPWSVHHLGNVRYPNGPLMVQDAVDTEALEAAALATLARATEQHVLRITVLPDPTLTVHDVIEIVGGPEEAQGRWLVESLRPGTEAGDPVVEIGARRTLTSAGISGVDMGGM